MPVNVTSKGRYALRMMVDLAQREAEGFVPLKDIAGRQDISLKYLEAIACDLKKASLLESGRGKDGGYRLRRRPEDYSVGEILRCSEESLAPVACLRDGEGCEKKDVCPTLAMWKELDGITSRYLGEVTLADLLSGKRWENK